METSHAALRRLRVVLPLLHLDRGVQNKLENRLRKTSKRLKKVRDIDAIIQLMDDLDESDRRINQALSRIKENVRQSVGWPRVGKLRGEASSDVKRLSAKLANLSQALKERERRPVGEGTVAPLEARTARRAARLKRALDASGSVYLADRLREPRRALQRLREDAELLADLAPAGTAAADIRTLDRMQAGLNRIRDLQRLIERVRAAQSEVPAGDSKAWHDLDALIMSLEARCHRLHARFVRDRAAVIEICDRLGAASAPAKASRKAS